MRLVPTILCGGAGSRLWPVSREAHPKPFIRLGDGESLLQKAFARAAALPGVEAILTVTNAELFFETRDDFAAVNARAVATEYLLEPLARNTAPAVAAAALHVEARHGADAVLLVLPADHLITDEAAFARAVGTALSLAGDGRLVTFGIRPDAPETGYGYIEAEGDRVVRFVEKPSLEAAKGYLASGRFLWNSGMFCFTARTVLDEMRAHCPEVLGAVRACLAKSGPARAGDDTRIALDRDAFALAPDISVDYALMERSKRLAVVACELGWSDIGSWKALAALVPPDADGNRVEGEALLHDVKDTYIRASGRVVAAVGVEGLAIVDTPDALLVASMDRVQDVKAVYSRLKAGDREAWRTHATVHRPWGTYTVLEEGPGFKIKRIEVNPGASLSLQLHRHRSEHWIVVSGEARVVNGGVESTVAVNESTFIPAGHRHRLSNPGAAPLVMIEVQSGAYLGEDDIVRFDDDYDRAAGAPNSSST